MDKRQVTAADLGLCFSSQGQIQGQSQIQGQGLASSTMCVFSPPRFQMPDMSHFFDYFVNSSPNLPRGAFFVLTESTPTPTPTVTMAIQSQSAPAPNSVNVDVHVDPTVICLGEQPESVGQIQNGSDPPLFPLVSLISSNIDSDNGHDYDISKVNITTPTQTPPTQKTQENGKSKSSIESTSKSRSRSKAKRRSRSSSSEDDDSYEEEVSSSTNCSDMDSEEETDSLGSGSDEGSESSSIATPSPTFSTTTTLDIDDDEYEDGICNINSFYFDPVTAIRWEHSYAVPFSPPPSPKRGQVSQRKRLQLQAKENECGQEKVKVVAVRRSTRAKIDESRTRIRKMINDGCLAADSGSEDGDEANPRRGEKKEVSDVDTLDLHSHSDWIWEIEEYSSYLVLGDSRIESNGVFAKYVIPPHVCFVEYKGKRISSKDADQVEACHRAAGVMHDYMFRIDENVTIDATFYESENLSKYINHSCSPNAYSSQIVWHGKKRIVLISLREILAGEEITYDYLFPPEPDPTKRIPCNCQALNCRKFINQMTSTSI